MSRCAVRIGSALALLAACALAQTPARADERLAFRLDTTSIVLTHVRAQGADRAVAVDDPGLASLLAHIGATLTWQPGERYVLFTTAQPAVISFAVGDTRYDVGPVQESAPFAPFVLDGHPYVPLDELLHALGFAIKQSGSHALLQPQLTSLQVQATGGSGAKFIAYAGVPLDGRVVGESPDKIVLLFDGVGSALDASPTPTGGPVSRIAVRTLGTVTHPQTQVTLFLAPGTTHSPPGTDDQRDFTLGFNGTASGQTIAQSAPEGVETQAPGATPAPSPSPAVAGPVQVTAVDTVAQNGSTTINIAVSGDTTYDWHRLRPPDNRWWLDVHNARLAIPPQNQTGNAPVTAIRVHQEDPDTVRVALSLSDFDTVQITPNATGATITITNAVADFNATPRTGSGTIGTNAVAQVWPVPGPWKFSPRPGETPYAAANPRLIVIDPGHGGSDFGSIHGGVIEKVVNLQISQRLRDILVARGWQVIMTRTDDRDVYKPYDDLAEEGGARDAVANSRGARLFISIHANAYENAGPHGATVYYYKPIDLALAQAIDRRIAAEVPVKNDGVVKDILYVLHHADMPSTLVETAFVSNPDDRALLTSPQWQQQMAQAIADGIEDFAGSAPPASAADGN